MDDVVRMGKSEDTFIPLPLNDRELAIEDLAFSSNPKNDKAINYAIECINKLAKIEQITNKWISLEERPNFCMMEIREILEQD